MGRSLWRAVPLAVVLFGCSNSGGPPPPPAHCDARTCGEAFLCGSIDDGCGRSLECGRCPEGESCVILSDRSYCDSSGQTQSRPKPTMIGRAWVDGDALRFAFPGTTFEARFSGTEVSVRLEELSGRNGTNRFVAQVDDGAPVTITAAPGTAVYSIAQGLAAGEHTVRITKRTEGLVGAARFLGFEFGSGTATALPEPERRLLFVGDSITTGYGILGAGPSCPFAADQEDFTATYAARTARALGAEAVAVAAAGKGALRNNDGSTAETMLDLFDRAAPFDADARWNAADDHADAAVITLGTNDFAPGVPDRDAFVAKMAALLAKVRAAMPEGPIVVTLSPMLSDSYPKGARYRSAAREYLQAAVTASGDSAVSFLEFELPTAGESYGCEWHPGPATHQRMADKLTATLKTALGW